MGAVLVVLIAVVTLLTLLIFFGRGTQVDAVRLNAIRTAGTIVLGTGGGIALLLAARRQRSTELDLLQKERDLEQKERAQHHQEQVSADTQALQVQVAEATERDAIERRITELYTTAANQLGSEKAPVRLAGLYALERLAQGNPTQRQTIVNLLCAYLRMPFAYSEDMATVVEVREEREVRITAQKILSRHTYFEPDDSLRDYWDDIEIDLSGATLIEWYFRRSRVDRMEFNDTVFVGPVDFFLVRVESIAFFRGAVFTSKAQFDRSRFYNFVTFEQAKFLAEANFVFGHFRSEANFANAEFSEEARFMNTQFGGLANFCGATFLKGVDLTDAGANNEISSTWPPRWTLHPSPIDSKKGVLRTGPRWPDETNGSQEET